MTAGTEPMLNLTQIIITAFGFLSCGPELQEPKLSGQTRPEPDPKSKSPTRQGLVGTSRAGGRFFPSGSKEKARLALVEGTPQGLVGIVA